MYSILIPARRHQRIHSLLESIVKCTDNHSNVEILFMTDIDDDLTPRAINEEIKKLTQFHAIRLFTRQRSEMLNQDYYNELAQRASGDLLWVFADDLQITKPHWDTQISEAVTAFSKDKQDKIFIISPKDNTPVPRHDMPKFPCFPMFTRECYEALGWLFPKQIPCWGVDYIMYLIFHPINRILELHEDNYINHISHHNHQIPADSVAERIGSIFNKLKMVPHYSTDRYIIDEAPYVRKHVLQKIQEYNKAHNLPYTEIEVRPIQ